MAMDLNENRTVVGSTDVAMRNKSVPNGVLFRSGYYFTPFMKTFWFQIIVLLAVNSVWLYSYYIIVKQKLWYSLVFGVVYEHFGGLGITAGCHRLWSHKSYSANVPLRIFLMIAQTAAGQQSIYQWSRDHRVHHKFSDTDADPYNINRGFFFAHMGWLLRKKHPELILKGNKLDFTDLLRDPVVSFQYRYYSILFLIFGIIIPTIIPMIFWSECFINAIFVNIFRYNICNHSTWFVNSAAHMFGERPYDKSIKPSENVFVSFGALGEGYHNFHHCFPFDYATSEMGGKLNFTKKFIDTMAYFGAAYNLKSVSRETISSRKEKVITKLDFLLREKTTLEPQ